MPRCRNRCLDVGSARNDYTMTSSTTKPESSAKTIEPGFVVEVWTRDHNPEEDVHGFVGEVQAVDERGIRIRLMDWVVSSFVGCDAFLPWQEVRQILIATPEHDRRTFLEEISSRIAARIERERGGPDIRF